eukprot:SAG22_NODE_1271_length_4929_cov_4.159420_7_plen_50_part_00
MNATQNTTYQPKSKGVSIYDVNKDRMVYYKNPYGSSRNLGGCNPAPRKS